MRVILRDVLDAVQDFSEGLGSRRITTYAAACAYYLFMSLVPVLMLLVSALQFTPLTEDVMLGVISEYVPESVYEVLESVVSGIYRGGRVAMTVSILLTIWSASASMKALMRGLDSVYSVERRDSFIVFSLRACFYMVLFVLTLIFSLIVLVYGGHILDLILAYSSEAHGLRSLLGIVRYLRYVVVLAILAAVFSMLYKWIPAQRGPYRRQLPGAAFAAVAWAVFSAIFSVYVSLSDKFGAYGYIGTIMVTMMWAFYCFYFLLMGGYINHFIAERRAHEE